MESETMKVFTEVKKPNTVNPRVGCVWVLGVIYVKEYGTRIRKNVFCGKRKMPHYHLCEDHEMERADEKEDDNENCS